MSAKTKSASIAVLVAAFAFASAAEQRATLRIRVVDGYGNPVRPSAIQLTSATGEDLSKRLRDGQAKDLPYGDYKLRILASGFQYWDRIIHVTEPTVWLTAGMELGAIDGPKPYCSFSGNVSGLSGSARARLLPLFANDIAETEIGVSGEFQFRAVECGEYVVVITHGSSAAYIGHVSLKGDTKPLAIRLGNATRQPQQ